MLPGNAKCSMTSLADTKRIFREIKIYLFMGPRISQLAKTTRATRLQSRFALNYLEGGGQVEQPP